MREPSISCINEFCNDDLHNRFFAAISADDLEGLEALQSDLGVPAVRKLQTRDGRTPLQVALDVSSRVVPLYLVQEKLVADINARDEDTGRCLLMSAIDQLELLEYLLQQPDIDVNAANKTGYSALHLAAYENKPRAAERLLRHPHLDVNAVTDEHNTPLHLACCSECSGGAEIVKQLLQHPDIHVNAKNDDAETAFHAAVQGRRWDVVALLVQHVDFQPCVPNTDGERALHSLIGGRAPLDLIQLVLQHPAVNVNQTTHLGVTPLMNAIQCEGRSKPKILPYLLQCPNLDVNAQDNLGNTALHFCVNKMQRGTAHLLLQHARIEPNTANIKGETPLHDAVHLGYLDFIESLWDTHPDALEVPNSSNGMTTLHYAVTECRSKTRQHRRAAVITYLLGHEVQEELRSSQEFELFPTTSGSMINTQDLDGNTALHLASRNGHLWAVDILLHHPRMNVDLRNKAGQKAADVAKTPEIQEHFQWCMADDASESLLNLDEIGEDEEAWVSQLMPSKTSSAETSMTEQDWGEIVPNRSLSLRRGGHRTGSRENTNTDSQQGRWETALSKPKDRKSSISRDSSSRWEDASTVATSLSSFRSRGGSVSHHSISSMTRRSNGGDAPPTLRRSSSIDSVGKSSSHSRIGVASNATWEPLFRREKLQQSIKSLESTVEPGGGPTTPTRSGGGKKLNAAWAMLGIEPPAELTRQKSGGDAPPTLRRSTSGDSLGKGDSRSRSVGSTNGNFGMVGMEPPAKLKQRIKSPSDAPPTLRRSTSCDSVGKRDSRSRNVGSTNGKFGMLGIEPPAKLRQRIKSCGDAPPTLRRSTSRDSVGKRDSPADGTGEMTNTKWKPLGIQRPAKLQQRTKSCDAPPTLRRSTSCDSVGKEAPPSSSESGGIMNVEWEPMKTQPLATPTLRQGVSVFGKGDSPSKSSSVTNDANWARLGISPPGKRRQQLKSSGGDQVGENNSPSQNSRRVLNARCNMLGISPPSKIPHRIMSINGIAPTFRKRTSHDSVGASDPPSHRSSATLNAKWGMLGLAPRDEQQTPPSQRTALNKKWEMLKLTPLTEQTRLSSQSNSSPSFNAKRAMLGIQSVGQQQQQQQPSQSSSALLNAKQTMLGIQSLGQRQLLSQGTSPTLNVKRAVLGMQSLGQQQRPSQSGSAMLNARQAMLGMQSLGQQPPPSQSGHEMQYVKQAMFGIKSSLSQEQSQSGSAMRNTKQAELRMQSPAELPQHTPSQYGSPTLNAKWGMLGFKSTNEQPQVSAQSSSTTLNAKWGMLGLKPPSEQHQLPSQSSGLTLNAKWAMLGLKPFNEQHRQEQLTRVDTAPTLRRSSSHDSVGKGTPCYSHSGGRRNTNWGMLGLQNKSEKRPQPPLRSSGISLNDMLGLEKTTERRPQPPLRSSGATLNAQWAMLDTQPLSELRQQQINRVGAPPSFRRCVSYDSVTPANLTRSNRGGRRNAKWDMLGIQVRDQKPRGDTPPTLRRSTSHESLEKGSTSHLNTANNENDVWASADVGEQTAKQPLDSCGGNESRMGNNSQEENPGTQEQPQRNKSDFDRDESTLSSPNPINEQERVEKEEYRRIGSGIELIKGDDNPEEVTSTTMSSSSSAPSGEEATTQQEQDHYDNQETDTRSVLRPLFPSATENPIHEIQHTLSHESTIMDMNDDVLWEDPSAELSINSSQQQIVVPSPSKTHECCASVGQMCGGL